MKNKIIGYVVFIAGIVGVWQLVECYIAFLATHSVMNYHTLLFFVIFILIFILADIQLKHKI